VFFFCPAYRSSPVYEHLSTLSDVLLGFAGSSEALLSGQKPPFRLLVRAVDVDGSPASHIRFLVSDAFVVRLQPAATLCMSKTILLSIPLEIKLRVIRSGTICRYSRISLSGTSKSQLKIPAWSKIPLEHCDLEIGLRRRQRRVSRVDQKFHERRSRLGDSNVY
jgi:hypothetical protein